MDEPSPVTPESEGASEDPENDLAAFAKALTSFMAYALAILVVVGAALLIQNRLF